MSALSQAPVSVIICSNANHYTRPFRCIWCNAWKGVCAGNFWGVTPQTAKSAHELIKVTLFFDMSHLFAQKRTSFAQSRTSPVSSRSIDFLGRDLLENVCTLASTCISNHLFQRKPLHPSLPMHLVQCLERGVMEFVRCAGNFWGSHLKSRKAHMN